MITGYFDPDGSPFVYATIRVPRLNAEGTFSLLFDTGADSTSLHLRDAIQLLSTGRMTGSFNQIWRQIRRRFRLLNNPNPIGGVGGTAIYLQEQAQIIFAHDDGTEQGFVFDLDIVKPARRGSAIFRHQLELPSLLGMDIISQFDCHIDYLNDQLQLVNH
jgi:hypothetical protein